MRINLYHKDLKQGAGEGNFCIGASTLVYLDLYGVVVS